MTSSAKQNETQQPHPEQSGCCGGSKKASVAAPDKAQSPQPAKEKTGHNHGCCSGH